MSIRREPTYLSYETFGALRLLAKAKSVPEENRIVTADEMADTLLKEVLKEKAPQLFDHQKQIAKLEKELLKTL